MSWLAASMLVLGVGLLAGFVWYERLRPDAKLIALVGTLAAFAALGRVAFAALPNVKPTTDIVLIAGFALGGAPGYVVGALAGLASNFFFGQGPWTPWQMFGWGLVGLAGAGLARLRAIRPSPSSPHQSPTGRHPPLTGPRQPLASSHQSPTGPRQPPASPHQPPASPRPARIGRWWLAASCFVVGFLFTAFQDFGSWVTYSDHSLRQLVVYVGQGIGFDLIHAFSCLAFAALFGPLFIRALERYRRRLRIVWHPAVVVAPPAAPLTPPAHLPAAARRAASTTAPLLAIAVCAAAVAIASAGRATPTAQATGSPLGYLRGAQNSDGGFPSTPGQASSSMVSGWAVLALSASGQSPGAAANGGASATAYLAATVGQDLGSIGGLERTILAVRGAGLDPRAFAGHDLVAALQSKRAANGSFASQTNLTAFAVLALRSAGATVPRATIEWLLAQQDSDGGFNFATGGAQSDVDDTGAVLQALAVRPLAGGSGHSGLAASGEWPKVTRAIKFIESAQNPDGGLPSMAGGASNSQSTAWGVQGLDAVGVDVAGLHRGGARSPLGYLRSLIGSGGAVAYARGQSYTPVWVTAEVLLALDGRPLPLSAPSLPSEPLRQARRNGQSQSAARTSEPSAAGGGGASGAAGSKGRTNAHRSRSGLAAHDRAAGRSNGTGDRADALYRKRLDRLLYDLGMVLGVAEGLAGPR